MPAVSQASQPVLYDARCSMCGKDTKVVFRPDGKRPVYCKACRKKLQGPKEPEELKEEDLPAPSVIPFSVSRRNNADKPKPKRKEVNLSELKKVLEESLEENEEPKSNKKGIINPGETVKF